MIVGGLAFTIYKKNMLIFAYETTNYEIDSGGKKGKAPEVDNDLGEDWKFQVVLQLKF